MIHNKNLDVICAICGGTRGLHNYMNQRCPKNINASADHTEYRDTVFSTEPPTPSGKKLTPMAKILKWVDEKYPNFNKADIEEYITSLLPEEREMVEKSYVAAQQAPEGMYTREQMMDIAGWMAAADNKRPISELKEEAEEYIRKIDVAKQFIQSLK